MKENSTIDKKYNSLIVLVSIVIPVVVAILFNVKLKDFGYDVEPLSFLPPIYATINGITAIVEIVYEKENPQNASINDFSSNWFLTLILGAFSIVFFLIGFFIPKNK